MKYRVSNPLDYNQEKSVILGATTGSTANSPFSTGASPKTTLSSPVFAPSQTQPAFGSSDPTSPVSTPLTALGGLGSSVPTPPIGSVHVSSPSPFGGENGPSFSSQSSFSGLASQSPQASSAGVAVRDMLTAIYQKYNPAKVAEVNRLLEKYKGSEEQLFRDIAKKYNLDPSTFGLPPAPVSSGFGSVPSATSGSAASPGGFGQQQVFGGPNFGGTSQSSPFSPGLGSGDFGHASPFGVGTGSDFGGFSYNLGSSAPVFCSSSSGGSSPFGASSIGSIAHPSGQGGFGGYPPMSGKAPTPFSATGSTSKSTFSSSSLYPPMPGKAPTP
jgi:hypothetical protein